PVFKGVEMARTLANYRGTNSCPLSQQPAPLQRSTAAERPAPSAVLIKMREWLVGGTVPEKETQPIVRIPAGHVEGEKVFTACKVRHHVPVVLLVSFQITLFIIQRAGCIRAVNERAHGGGLGTEIAAGTVEPDLGITQGQYETRMRKHLNLITPQHRPGVVLKCVVIINHGQRSA